MGNICAGLFYEKDPQDDDEARTEASKKPKPNKPKPMIFALMRNGHEVIRGNMADIDELLSNGDLEGAVRSYHDLHKWMSMHMLMEEGNQDDGSSWSSPRGFFSILDERFDGIAKERQLRDDHSALDVLEKSLVEAGKGKGKGGADGDGDIETFKKIFEEYKQVNEAHLLKEEEVMMPKVQAMVKSGVNMKELMIHEILALVVDSPDFKFFVQHANTVLDKHSGAMPKVRVFDHALWACATATQWKEWKGWIEESLPQARYEEVMAVVGNLD